MVRNTNCIICSSKVEKNAIGLYRKLIEKNAKKFMCLKCLANHLDTSTDDLLEKIDDFKATGCKLFE